MELVSVYKQGNANLLAPFFVWVRSIQKVKKLVYFREMKICLHPTTISYTLTHVPLDLEEISWQDYGIKTETVQGV